MIANINSSVIIRCVIIDTEVLVVEVVNALTTHDHQDLLTFLMLLLQMLYVQK